MELTTQLQLTGKTFIESSGIVYALGDDTIKTENIYIKVSFVGGEKKA